MKGLSAYVLHRSYIATFRIISRSAHELHHMHNREPKPHDEARLTSSFYHQQSLRAQDSQHSRSPRSQLDPSTTHKPNRSTIAAQRPQPRSFLTKSDHFTQQWRWISFGVPKGAFRCCYPWTSCRRAPEKRKVTRKLPARGS